MLSFLGLLAVLTGLAGAIAVTVQGARSAAGKSVSLRQPVAILTGGAVAAMLVLETAILANDFTVRYVADHHSRNTPFPFNIATGWAALEGSIVLWGLVLAGYTWATHRRYERAPDGLGAAALAVMGLVAVFFFGVMATIANPFETCIEAAARSCLDSSPIPFVSASAPADGFGPNPLLQNHILMAIHPPMLYLGYIGLTVPFAYGIAALALGRPGTAWLVESKRSTTVAWSFLTLGIVLGSWWAYEVLSWGGWWAWDPVENASFMPWLIATAFLHSSLVQIRRGMLQSWNFVLVISAFALTILGTFLTRSGTIESVHSFTQSAIGPALLGFLALILVGSFSLFALRATAVAQPSRLDSLSSREGAFLLNNLLLTVYAIVVLVGTIYPIVLEAYSGDRVTVGAPFFDRLTAPLSFGLLLAMGVGPVMPWRLARAEVVWRRIHGPLQTGLAAAAITAVALTRVGWVVAVVATSVFLISVAVRHAWVQASHASRVKKTSLVAEFRRLFQRDPGYWGGQVSHIGVAVIAIGIAFATNLSTNTQVSVVPGDVVQFDGYELTYTAPFLQRYPNREVQGARILVAKDGKQLDVLEPSLNIFANSSTAIGSPAVRTSLGGDLYLSVRAIDPESVTLRLDASPMQWLLWFGGMVTAAGGFVSYRGRLAARRDREPSFV